jgi:hypothetical protein
MRLYQIWCMCVVGRARGWGGGVFPSGVQQLPAVILVHLGMQPRAWLTCEGKKGPGVEVDENA